MIIDNKKDQLVLFLESLNKLSTRDSFKCTYAAGTSQAIEMLKYLVPDFLFLNYDLSRVNGLELLDILQRNKKLDKTIKVMYCVQAFDEIAEKAIKLGVKECIPQPTDQAAFSEKLSELFNLDTRA